MFWALMMMSHLPPVTAAMIVSKTEFSISGVSPSRLAISWPISMSEPIGLPWASKNSCGGYGRSEQMTSLPGKISSASGIVAIGLPPGVPGAVLVAGVPVTLPLGVDGAPEGLTEVTGTLPPVLGAGEEDALHAAATNRTLRQSAANRRCGA